jgi:hypothetical protein
MTDFTEKKYRHILETAKAGGYTFLSFEDGVQKDLKPGKFCLLRHDIDADLGAALKMAQVEHSLGIKATYFLMLRSPVYNLFSRHNHRFVQEIINLGHYIGVHYDGSFLPHNTRSINEWVHHEAAVLENMFHVKITTVSFHQPNEDILSNKIKISGLINTYDKNDLSHFQYISDSNKQWKSQHPEDIFKDGLHPRLHLLIHPMWWMQSEQNLPTPDVWNITLKKNLERMQEQLLATERAYGNKRKFDINE